MTHEKRTRKAATSKSCHEEYAAAIARAMRSTQGKHARPPLRCPAPVVDLRGRKNILTASSAVGTGSAVDRLNEAQQIRHVLHAHALLQTFRHQALA